MKELNQELAMQIGIEHTDVDRTLNVDQRAIDIAFCTVNCDPAIRESIEGQGTTLNILSRNSDTLEEFVLGVLINTRQDLVDNGHVHRWGERMLFTSDYGRGTNGYGEVNRRVTDFLLDQKPIFGVEIPE